MCSPTAIASFALSAVSSAVQARATNKAARQQYAVTQQQYDLTERNRQLNEQAFLTRQQEITEDAGNEHAALAREAARVRAQQLVASAEGGGGGNTSLALLRDIGFQSGLQSVAIGRQATRETEQTRREIEANNLNAQTTNLNTASGARAVPTASPLNTGLQIAGAGLGAASRSPSTIKGPRIRSSFRISPNILNGDT